MLRYEYEYEGKQIVFVNPAHVLSIGLVPIPSRFNAHRKGSWCRVELSTGAKVIVPLSPDVFAAEVEKALNPNEI